MLVDEFGITDWRTRPYRELLAWHRLAYVRAFNRKQQAMPGR